VAKILPHLRQMPGLRRGQGVIDKDGYAVVRVAVSKARIEVPANHVRQPRKDNTTRRIADEFLIDMF